MLTLKKIIFWIKNEVEYDAKKGASCPCCGRTHSRIVDKYDGFGFIKKFRYRCHDCFFCGAKFKSRELMP